MRVVSRGAVAASPGLLHIQVIAVRAAAAAGSWSNPIVIQGQEAAKMRGAVMYAPGDIRVEDRVDPRIVAPTDAIIRLSASCICGSDLWPYRGVDAVHGPSPMGHEYAGIVEEVGSAVTTGPSCGGLPGHGRAPGDQGIAAALTQTLATQEDQPAR